jgi:hypothetical protein
MALDIFIKGRAVGLRAGIAWTQTHSVVEEPYRQTFAAPRDMEEFAARMNFWDIEDARVAEQVGVVQ